MPTHWRFRDITDLETWDVEPLVVLIDGFLAASTLTFVGAASQTGKTLLFLYLARLLAQGGRFLDQFDVRPAGNVLYLALEDPERRYHERLLETDPEFDRRPEPGKFQLLIAPGLSLINPSTFDWIEALIQETWIRVLVLDTYQRSTPGLSSFDDTQQSVILHRLAEITRRLQCTIIILDHIRKVPGGKPRRELGFDDIKGTGGKMQNADTVILMDRVSDRDPIRFRAKSKDWDKEIGILIDVQPKNGEPPKFRYAGELETLKNSSKQTGDRNRKRVLESFWEGGWLQVHDIEKRTKLSRGTVQRHLKALAASGDLDCVGDGRGTRYRATASDDSNA